MAPDSLQVAHIGADRCNITWNVSPSSHYFERSLEFEARTRSSGRTWEVGTWPSLTCADSSFLSWSPCPSFIPTTPWLLQQVITNLKQQKFIISKVQQPEVGNPGNPHTLECSREKSIATSSDLCLHGPRVPLAASSSSCHPSSASLLCLSLIRSLVIGLRAQLDNPRCSYLRIFNLSASARTLPPDEITLHVLGG